VVADAAIAAMRAQADPTFVAPLLEALEQREKEFTSGGFAGALGTLAWLARNEEQKATVREFLIRQTNHPRRQIQRAALAALGDLGDPQGLAVLKTFAGAAKDSPERQAAEKAIASLRAGRKPADDLGELRGEVLGLQKENRELRQSVEDLKLKFTETTKPTEAGKTTDPKKKKK
jgi:HEAT repeat protein